MGCLKGVLFEPEKGYDEVKDLFISHCTNFARVFKSMSNSREYERYAITLFEDLKFLREEKKHLDKELGKIKAEKKNDNEVSE